MKTIRFVSGMPRSGSTLLVNILLQNPRFYGTGTSGLLDVLRAIRDTCDGSMFFKAMPQEERNRRKLEILRGALYGGFAHVERPVCFDKNRGWPTVFELAATLLGGRDTVRSIVCVRDLRDVLASFEKLYRTTQATSTTPQERGDFISHRTAAGRAGFMLKDKEPVGYSVNVILDAITRGWRPSMCFVDYDALCREPEATMARVYEFLGEELFVHDFDSVERLTQEDDSIHGFVGLHDIRTKVEPQEPQWRKVYDNTVFRTPMWAQVTERARFWERPSDLPPVGGYRDRK